MMNLFSQSYRIMLYYGIMDLMANALQHMFIKTEVYETAQFIRQDIPVKT